MATNQTYTLPISVKGIIFEDNAVWLRKNERNEWELPGGKLNPGEQPTETVGRELQEELGFSTKIEVLIDAFVYQIDRSDDEQHGVLVISYLCQISAKTDKFELEGEAGPAEFALHNLEDIESLSLPEFYRAAIRRAWAWQKEER